MGGLRAEYELFRRCLVGGWDREASCSSDDLVFSPGFREIVESSPERSELPFNLQSSNSMSVMNH